MGVCTYAQVQPNVSPYDPYSARTCCNGPIESLKWILKQQSAPSETAAIIVEPIMGEGGFLTPPPSFLPALRKICDEHGIVLIIDEVTFWHPEPAMTFSSPSCLTGPEGIICQGGNAQLVSASRPSCKETGTGFPFISEQKPLL